MIRGQRLALSLSKASRNPLGCAFSGEFPDTLLNKVLIRHEVPLSVQKKRVGDLSGFVRAVCELPLLIHMRKIGSSGDWTKTI